MTIASRLPRLWRAMVTISDYGSSTGSSTSSCPVSFNTAPACRTDSVTHNPTMRYLLNAMELMPPNEAFEPATAGRLMTFLLLADVLLVRRSTNFFSGGAHHFGGHIGPMRHASLRRPTVSV